MTDFGVPCLLDLLTETERKLVTAAAVRRNYRDGQEILGPSHEPNGISIVIEGAVSISRMRRDGAMALATIARAGQNFYDIVAIGQSQPKHRAMAVGDAVVDHIPKSAFLRLLDEQPGFARALYRVTAHRLVTAIDMWDDTRLLSANARTARMLLRLLDSSTEPARIALRQEELAQLVGVTAVTIAGTLKRLTKEGLIRTGYGVIHIPDRAALAAWVYAEAGD
jgi:CRP-like cAMP-binding protein